jgi:catechol 2,3-dioxygenase-like lactoylglutathione lyase family enzyme
VLWIQRTATGESGGPGWHAWPGKWRSCTLADPYKIATSRRAAISDRHLRRPGTLIAMPERGSLHHVELWVPDLTSAESSWGWLLGQLGYRLAERWNTGQSWRRGDIYVVLEAGPDVVDAPHDRRRPGVNHLAFHAGSRADVDAIVRDAPSYGWTLLFADRHPFAGGADHYAAYLEDPAGFEVELVPSG